MKKISVMLIGVMMLALVGAAFANVVQLQHGMNLLPAQPGQIMCAQVGSEHVSMEGAEGTDSAGRPPDPLLFASPPARLDGRKTFPCVSL